jgi:heme/copper-type cytochrome/quinol oxidase subunit 4
VTPFQQTYFRAGHAHAGVLLLMSLLYFLFMERTHLAPGLQLAGAIAVIVGVLAQSGGFFLHMGVGQPGRGSLGTMATSIGALILVAAIALLVYGLIAA